MEDSEVSSSDSEEDSEHKFGDSSKGSGEPKKREVLRTVTGRFSKALGLNTYHLVERSSLYYEKVEKHVAKGVSRLQVEMKTQTSDSMDPISRIGFLHTLKMKCDNNCIHEGAAIWLCRYFMKTLATALLTAQLSIEVKPSHYSVKVVLITYG